MSSTSRPQTTGTSNVQSPSKPSQVESTNPPPNAAQPLYQNNPNQQYIQNIRPMELLNSAQQLQFQSLTNIQTAAFFQRQSQLMQQQQLIQQQSQQQQSPQQQQQQNSAESQIKNQPIANGPLGSFPNLPDLLNFFLLSNQNLNIPMSQLNPNQTPVQQPPLQTPKTVPVSPSKSGQSQHAPRSATIGPRSTSANINNAQTAELDSAVTPSATVSEQNAEIPKKALTSSPTKVSSDSSSVSTPSSTISDRLLEEVKERANALQEITKNALDDTTPSNSNTTPPNDTVHSPETNKSTLPRRKQTNATGISPIKANTTISPSNHTVQHDSPVLSTPKKTEDVKSSSSSPCTPVTTAKVETPTTPDTSADKKVKQTRTEVTVQKPSKKSEVEPQKTTTTTTTTITASTTTTTTVDRKLQPALSAAQAVSSSSMAETIVSDIKSKRNRVQTNLYQSPTPELVLATRMSVSEANKNSGTSKDKLIIFFADEFIAVRNDEGSFFLCQCQHNMYRSSKKCRVRWLNQDDNSENTYKLTFFDYIDKECILTSVSLENVADKYTLTDNERERIDNILKKSIDVEKGILPRPEVTEENPDGLDISLYKSESQIKTDDAADSSPKAASSLKKIKPNTKTSKDPPPNRRKSDSSSVAPKKKILTKRLGKTVQRKQNESTSSPSDESGADAGKKKVTKTKKRKKSTDSSTASAATERTLRKRSKN